MKVQMLNLLATVGSHIGKGPIATLLDADFIGDLDHELKQRVAHAPLPVQKLVKRDDVLSWHYQHVLWGLRVEIAKSDESGVFKNDVAGDFPFGDPTE
jgi:hypothetical protein